MKSVIRTHCSSVRSVPAVGIPACPAGRLGPAGVGQAQLVGAGGLDEILQGRELQLPAEPAEPAVGQPGDPATDLGVPGPVQADETGRGHVLAHVGDQGLVGDHVDQAVAEKGRGVALGDHDAGGRRRRAVGQLVEGDRRRMRQAGVDQVERLLEPPG